MNNDSTDDPQSVAIEQLERFGLSTYAARTFVALVRLGTGTARDVSEASTVPRTRVYDAVEELQDRGLVDVQHSSPKEFWAISAETVSRMFVRELQRRQDILLDELEIADRQSEQRDVWTVDGEPTISRRVREFLADAESEIVYMTVEDLLTEDLIAELAAAADRGVSIKLGGISPAVQERIQEDIPGATVFESLRVWSDTPADLCWSTDRRP